MRYRGKKIERPTVEQIKTEIERSKRVKTFGRTMLSTVYILLSVAAAAILVATLVFPVLRIYGESMTPTLKEGEIVVSLKGAELKTGDVIAFYYNNRILIKRVICGPGEWVSIDDDGVVSVNGEVIDEPYINTRSKGICDLDMPYQVPEKQYFVMGDERESSIDSRSSVVGCVEVSQIIGRIVFVVWPFESFGFI